MWKRSFTVPALGASRTQTLGLCRIQLASTGFKMDSTGNSTSHPRYRVRNAENSTNSALFSQPLFFLNSASRPRAPLLQIRNPVPSRSARRLLSHRLRALRLCVRYWGSSQQVPPSLAPSLAPKQKIPRHRRPSSTSADSGLFRLLPAHTPPKKGDQNERRAI